MDATAVRQDPNRFARELFTGLGDRYDGLAELLSFGQNARWRRAMVDRVVETHPKAVLDVATGTAGVALQIAARCDATLTGIDLTRDMLERGTRNVARAGMSQRIRLLQGRAEQLPFADGTFDALTFTYLLRYVADPAATLRELARVVRTGGRIASLEFSVPPNRFWRGSWWLYTRTLLPAAGALGGRDWYEVGRFLGPSISDLYRRLPLDEQVRLWEAAGIERVGVRRMSLGGGVVMWGTRSDD